MNICDREQLRSSSGGKTLRRRRRNISTCLPTRSQQPPKVGCYLREYVTFCFLSSHTADSILMIEDTQMEIYLNGSVQKLADIK